MYMGISTVTPHFGKLLTLKKKNSKWVDLVQNLTHFEN